MLLLKYDNGLSLKANAALPVGKWQGAEKSLITEPEAIYHYLCELDRDFFIVQTPAGIALGRGGEIAHTGYDCLGRLQALKPEWLGNEQFKQAHQTKFAYHAGAMANGIASAEMVIALGKQGYLASFGAAGLPLDKVEAAIQQIQAALGPGPYAFNLIHSPADPKIEKNCLDLYLRYGIKTIEASAFMSLSANLVRWRAKGLSRGSQGEIISQHRLIVKISRREVAEPYLQPAPVTMLDALVAQGEITIIVPSSVCFPLSKRLAITTNRCMATVNRSELGRPEVWEPQLRSPPPLLWEPIMWYLVR
jgi:trans-AT polyketide synthase/acyltransferase/oxidoreductase domain-containing protein